MPRHLFLVGFALSFAAFAQDIDTLAVEEQRDDGFIRLENPAFPVPQEKELSSAPIHLMERADLSQYFASGKLAEAKAAFDAGKYGKAIALLDSVEASLPVRFLRALAAHRSGNWKFSAKEFEALATQYPALRERCLVQAGWGYEQLQDWPSALRVYGQVGARSRLTPDGRFGAARASRALRDFKKAQESLAEYAERPAPPWGRDVGAEALLGLADVFLARKDLMSEKATLLKLWSNHPLSKEAAKAAARLSDLNHAPKEYLVARAEALIDAHRNAQGIALVTPLMSTLKIPHPLACRAQFALGKGYRKLRQHAKAMVTLAPLSQCKDPELRARANFTLGFSQSVVAPTLAAMTYESVAAEFPAHPLADDALYFAADAHLKQGERQQAMERLFDVVDRYPLGDFAADALFRLFWVAREEGNFETALEYLTEIEGRWGRADDSYEMERAQYWRARLFEQQAREVEALALFETVATQHPATYYGLLSRERVWDIDERRGKTLLTAITAAPDAVDPFPLPLGPLSEDRQFLNAVELMRLGLGELVPAEILAVDRTALPAESLRVMVLVLAAAKEDRAAHGLARLWLRRDLSGPITAERRAIWEIAYPKAFRELVATHAKSANDLDPDLLQALMREESALDPKALSWAGALGLCQLMPATAAEVASQLKLKPLRQAQLLEPELNIQLGARYLSDLVIRLKGIKPFALASYNAGESAVARWRRENGEADLPAWVELVPLQETRGYVKRVLRSYNTYKLLYAPGEQAKTVAPVPQRTAALRGAAR